MFNLRTIGIGLILLWQTTAVAQHLSFARPIMDSLCSPRMAGRGYVNDGVNVAANFIARKLSDIGLAPVGQSYYQKYSFPINTFPTEISCSLDGKAFMAGEHFLINPNSRGFRGDLHILPFSIKNELDRDLLYAKLQRGIGNDEIILFREVDDNRALRKYIDSLSKLGFNLNRRLVGSTKKLLWTPSQETSDLVELTFPDSIIANKDHISIDYSNKFYPEYGCKNVIAYVPGKKKKMKDCIVFTAHYDHLGMLGNKAYFPGASDNASGVSMLLSLANYFQNNPLDVPVYFIFFSGEEVGLLGSEYFVKNPTFDLKRIKALINVDIMGSAEEGITVVNGETYKNIFDRLVDINKRSKYLPEVKIRGKAQNSDHYYFGELGVPAIFIYSNGGPGWYHDVWDTPASITTTNFDAVGKLLIEFAKGW